MWTYAFVNKTKVFDEIKKQSYLFAIDLKGLKVLEVNSLTINQINYYIESPDSFFYVRTEVTNE